MGRPSAHASPMGQQTDVNSTIIDNNEQESTP
jgi:hypothetical protein